MKNLMIILSLMFPAAAFAEVADFNALISENQKAQSALHKDLTNSVKESRMAIQKRQTEERIFVDVKHENVNVPTARNFLRFKKEMVDYQPSTEAIDKRLANEFDSVDMEF